MTRSRDRARGRTAKALRTLDQRARRRPARPRRRRRHRRGVNADRSRGKAPRLAPARRNCASAASSRPTDSRAPSSSSCTPTTPSGDSCPARRSPCRCPTSSPWHGKTLELPELRWYNGHPVAFFEGVDDRTRGRGAREGDPVDRPGRRRGPRRATRGTTTSSSASTSSATATRSGGSSRVDHLPAQDLLIVTVRTTARCSCRSSRRSCPRSTSPAGTVTVTPPPASSRTSPTTARRRRTPTRVATPRLDATPIR